MSPFGSSKIPIKKFIITILPYTNKVFKFEKTKESQPDPKDFQPQNPKNIKQ